MEGLPTTLELSPFRHPTVFLFTNIFLCRAATVQSQQQKVSAPKRRRRAEGQLLVAEFASSGTPRAEFAGVGI